MDILLRLLLRFVLVPLGYLAAVTAGAAVILLGSWHLADALVSAHPDASAYGLFGFVIAGPVLFALLLAVMWLPGAIGILISEAFAIRSWIFHALNGAIAGWVGWQLFSNIDESGVPLNEPQYVFAAGLAGGFAYWAVAGWSAGFWKPAPRSEFLHFAHVLLGKPVSTFRGHGPVNPPARTEA